VRSLTWIFVAKIEEPLCAKGKAGNQTLFLHTGDQTNLPVMETFENIIALGNAAANAGEPLVNNWPQVRGALLMLGRAAGGPDKVQTSTFHIQFPASFDAL
jgi:hypothetical protein